VVAHLIDIVDEFIVEGMRFKRVSNAEIYASRQPFETNTWKDATVFQCLEAEVPPVKKRVVYDRLKGHLVVIIWPAEPRKTIS
jgi:hypothetical protein